MTHSRNRGSFGAVRVMEGSAIQAAGLVLFSDVEVVSSRISVRVLGPAGGGEAEVSEGPGGGDGPAKEGLRQVPHHARVGRKKATIWVTTIIQRSLSSIRIYSKS